MDSSCSHRLFACVVSQFGYLRIEAYLQLPAAFRSLSRPSSAPDAKAFTLCSFSLELRLLSLANNCLGVLFNLSAFAAKLSFTLTKERPFLSKKSFLNYLFVCFCIRFSMNISEEPASLSDTGGLKWTRTTDLALIRRAL